MRDTVIVGGYEYRHADGQWGIRKVGADVPFGPVTWPHTVALIERIRELEALAATPRVRVLDEWRVVDKRGHHATYHPFILRTPEDHAMAVSWCDEQVPQDAPHRVVRVAMVEEDSHQSVPSDHATRVTDEMVERAAKALHDAAYTGGYSWENQDSHWQDVVREKARIALTAALEGPRD